LTLNMALGRVSVTTAITSIASSFDKPHPASGDACALPCFWTEDLYSVRILAPVAVTATVCSK
jgi:hypothetical protein